jgi:hypothetical protein
MRRQASVESAEGHGAAEAESRIAFECCFAPTSNRSYGSIASERRNPTNLVEPDEPLL